LTEKKIFSVPKMLSCFVVLVLLLTMFQFPISKDFIDLQDYFYVPSRASRSETGRQMVVESTAYSYTGQLTKMGNYPEDNYTVAVDPNVIPLGSNVVFDGASHLASDTGKLVKGFHIDRYMADPQKAKDYGVKWIVVTVYPPGNT